MIEFCTLIMKICAEISATDYSHDMWIISSDLFLNEVNFRNLCWILASVQWYIMFDNETILSIHTPNAAELQRLRGTLVKLTHHFENVIKTLSFSYIGNNYRISNVFSEICSSGNLDRNNQFWNFMAYSIIKKFKIVFECLKILE